MVVLYLAESRKNFSILTDQFDLPIATCFKINLILTIHKEIVIAMVANANTNKGERVLVLLHFILFIKFQ